ncbi:MAG: YhbY family RNA-binding protein [Oscillospiraceae bacterium]|jgi:RNA-binding protein|nr:YhbY family RNA-binding protein [Oscillospiraceae bacterium]
MLNSGQRAKLRAMANSIDTILHIGKDGVTDNVEKQCSGALAARELIKGRVLPNSGLTPREAAGALARRCLAEVVQIAGSRFVLYRENPEIAPEKRVKLAAGARK